MPTVTANRRRLTKRLIDATPLPPEGPVRLYDSEVRGLHLRSTPGGTRTWYVFYRDGNNRQRDHKLGRHPVMSPELARQRANEVLADVSRGIDLAGRRGHRRRAVTIGELADRFLAEHVEKKLKPKSVVQYRSVIELYVRPRLGEVRVVDITPAQIQAVHGALSDRRGQANHVVAVLRKMLSLAVDWGLRPDGVNPASRVRFYSDHKRNRYLAAEEFQRLWRVLDEEEASGVVSDAPLAIRLLMTTGRRLGEVLGLTWADLDLEGGRMRLADSKVGARTFNLSPETVALLKAVRTARDGESGYVVRGQKPGRPLINLQQPWRRIRRKAGLDDVRLHDLRHSYASFAAAAGYDLARIKEMLGHQTIQTTQRYAHIADKDVRTSVHRVGGFLHDIVTSPASPDAGTSD